MKKKMITLEQIENHLCDNGKLEDFFEDCMLVHFIEAERDYSKENIKELADRYTVELNKATSEFRAKTRKEDGYLY